MFVEFTVTLRVESYIAEPYWPAKDRVVDILKKSGMNRAKSDQKREEALSRYLESVNMSRDDFKKLQAEADAPWYVNAEGMIFIPRHHMSAALVNATVSAPSTVRLKTGELRSLLQVGDFITDRKTHDGVFERFVRAQSQGKILSNQRRMQRSFYIKDARAVGRLAFDPDDTKPEQIEGLLKYAGKYVGVGASRKMAYGRFTIESFTRGSD